MSLKQYESQQHRIEMPADRIFAMISDFNNLTPVLADKVEDWHVDGDCGDQCSFRAKGFSVSLKMEERVASKHVKVVPVAGGSPMDFGFWIQLHSVSATDTRFRLVLKAELNTMMNMMIGGKIQGALDQVAEQVAHAFTLQRG